MKDTLQPPAALLSVLLVGAEAEALGPRLRLSGYRLLSEAGMGEPVAGPPEQPERTPAGPDAIILSPGREESIGELRGHFGAVPLLLGISEDTVAGRCDCLASGADDFWLSSLGPSDLLMRLRVHLGLARQETGTQELLRVGDLQLQPNLRQVRRGQRLLELTSREYQLLLLLIRHGDRIVSRERILGEIWSDQKGASSNVIEVYVRYLRQKLEAGGERRILHTVRGRGYCLSEAMPPREIDS